MLTSARGAGLPNGVDRPAHRMDVVLQRASPVRMYGLTSRSASLACSSSSPTSHDGSSRARRSGVGGTGHGRVPAAALAENRADGEQQLLGAGLQGAAALRGGADTTARPMGTRGFGWVEQPRSVPDSGGEAPARRDGGEDGAGRR